MMSEGQLEAGTPVPQRPCSKCGGLCNVEVCAACAALPSNLVSRLRQAATVLHVCDGDPSLYREAADEVERLRAVIQAAKEPRIRDIVMYVCNDCSARRTVETEARHTDPLRQATSVYCQSGAGTTPKVTFLFATLEDAQAAHAWAIRRPAREADPLADVRWICQHCTTVNGVDNATCLGCRKPRSALKSGADPFSDLPVEQA